MTDPVFLTVQRAGRPEHTPEVEGVLIQCTGDDVAVTLDDGETITFQRDELLAALVVSLDHARAA